MTRYLKVLKVEMESIGYHYLSLTDLIKVYKSHPEITQNVIGNPLTPDKYTLAHRLLEKPSESAPLVAINIPLLSSVPDAYANPKITILSQDGYWFQVELHFRFIYNGSSNPNICARSLFDEKFTGYWTANTNELDYPYLILCMLKNEYWKDFSKLIEEK